MCIDVKVCWLHCWLIGRMWLYIFYTASHTPTSISFLYLSCLLPRLFLQCINLTSQDTVNVQNKYITYLSLYHSFARTLNTSVKQYSLLIIMAR